MKYPRVLFLIGCLVCLGSFLAPKTKASERNQKTFMTFSEPVELPGIVLPAGKYVFRLVNFSENRNMVQILSQDEQKVLATISTIPAYRVNPTSATTIVYEERRAGGPHAIKEWYFPDRRYGHEFVYSKTEALELAKADTTESTSSQAESAQSKPDEFQPATIEPELMASYSENIEPEESSYAQLMNERQTEMTNQEQSFEQPTSSQPAPVKALPKTASPLPLIGFSGILLLAGSLGLRLFAKRLA
jgi:hypothetical protein